MDIRQLIEAYNEAWNRQDLDAVAALLEREADPKGDRVRITMSGKFLPYATY